MFIATDLIRPGPSVINGHAPRLRPLEPPRIACGGFGPPLGYLAVAAFLLALLGAAALIRFTSWGDSSVPSKGGPAIFAPATPSPETARRKPARGHLPVDVVPTGMMGKHSLPAHDSGQLGDDARELGATPVPRLPDPRWIGFGRERWSDAGHPSRPCGEIENVANGESANSVPVSGCGAKRRQSNVDYRRQ